MEEPLSAGRFVSPLDRLSALQRARVMQLAQELGALQAAGGSSVLRLRGRHLVALCGAVDCPHASPFTSAAGALGARVSRVRLDDVFDPAGGDVKAITALLGRLYDGIGCPGISAEQIERLELLSGKPVFGHALCSPLACGAMTGDPLVDQALLLATLA